MVPKIFYATIVVVFSVVLAVAQADTVTIEARGKPISLNPLKDLSLATWSINQNLYHLVHIADSDLSSGLGRFGSLPYANRSGVVKNFEVVNEEDVLLHLRDNIRFHDGSKLTARDVAYSIEYIRSAKDSDFKLNVVGIKKIQVIDDYLLKISTDKKVNGLISNLDNVSVVKKGSATELPPIGSGPYYIKEFSEDLSVIKLEKSTYYIDNDFDIDSATYIYTKDKDERVDKFISGEADLLVRVSPAGLARVKKSVSEVNVSRRLSKSIRFLSMDQFRDESPHIRTYDGKRLLGTNPFKVKAVREAISLAIDRNYLVDKVLDKGGIAANQHIYPENPKHIKSISNEPYDVGKAKKLMNEAGYKDGFSVTLHSTSGQMIESEAIAKMLGKIKIKIKINVKVEYAKDTASFFAKAKNTDYSFLISGWGSSYPSSHIKNLFVGYNAESKIGLNNFGRYSNPLVNEIYGATLVASSEAEKDALERQAMLVATEDKATIPLYHPNVTWVAHKPYHYNTYRADTTILPNIERLE